MIGEGLVGWVGIITDVGVGPRSPVLSNLTRLYFAMHFCSVVWIECLYPCAKSCYCQSVVNLATRYRRQAGVCKIVTLTRCEGIEDHEK